MPGLIGQPVRRKEGVEKVTGRRLYLDDLRLPEFAGLLHGATIRSPIARGRITGLRFDPVVPWDEFTVVTARDISGRNRVAGLVLDQPFLADGVVNHPEEAVALIAHPDEQLLEKARAAVHVEVEPLPPVFDLDASLRCEHVILGDDNVIQRLLIDKGDVEGALAAAARIVLGEYLTGAQEQLYIEPNGMVGRYDPLEGVTVWGSLQCPYYVHKALGPLFELPAERVRVIQVETGGGFGGKEEYPSMLAGHVALLARKSGRPVKIVYDRAEDMLATTKRHPSRTRHRTALDAAGRITAMDIEFVLDGGAYTTLSPVVLSRGAIHAAGPYQVPNVRIRALAVATNAPPHGAFRGFGAPQSCFALERHMDKVAAAAGVPPDELRRRHFLVRGGVTATSQTIREDPDLDRLLQRAFELSGYYEKRGRFALDNAAGGALRRGIGFATFMHGAGFTGSGERVLRSQAAVEATAEGRVRVLTSSTEMGQGTNTVFSQIVAQALGLDCEDVDVVMPDTRLVPDSGPTVASRTVMVVGKLVEDAALRLREQLVEAGCLAAASTRQQFRGACGVYLRDHPELRATARNELGDDLQWDDRAYRGDAYATYAWAAYVAEVTVDLDTGETRVDDFTAVQEAGHVVNPVLAGGQIEGGVAQGVGYALYEQVVWREGRMANARMTNYIMPTAADVPRIRVEFVEKDSPFGPGAGAKGIGELPLDGTAPAVANAVTMATGVPVDTIPFLPEDLLARQAERNP